MLLQHYQKKKKEKKNSLLFTLEIHIRRCKPTQNFQYHKNFKTKCGSKILMQQTDCLNCFLYYHYHLEKMNRS